MAGEAASSSRRGVEVERDKAGVGSELDMRVESRGGGREGEGEGEFGDVCQDGLGWDEKRAEMR